MSDHGVPSSVLVMAEHGLSDPVWDRPGGTGDPLDLDDLGVPGRLVASLRAWNARYQALAGTGYAWPTPEEQAAWLAEGRSLAYDLQAALPGIEVRYAEDGDARPVRERRGP